MMKKFLAILFCVSILNSCMVIPGSLWDAGEKKETEKKDAGVDADSPGKNEESENDSGDVEDKDEGQDKDDVGILNDDIVVELDADGYGPCPYEIKQRVFHYAEEYCKSDTVYKYGGQDPLRKIGIDCSGLVIMCYTYALEGTGYELVLPDMSSSYMKDKASYKTENPEKGDLIFMGDASSSVVNHIAIFEKADDKRVYFIDSTEYGNVSGVTRRSYEKNNSKFKSYGVMKIKKKK